MKRGLGRSKSILRSSIRPYLFWFLGNLSLKLRKEILALLIYYIVLPLSFLFLGAEKGRLGMVLDSMCVCHADGRQ